MLYVELGEMGKKGSSRGGVHPLVIERTERPLSIGRWPYEPFGLMGAIVVRRSYGGVARYYAPSCVSPYAEAGLRSNPGKTRKSESHERW